MITLWWSMPYIAIEMWLYALAPRRSAEVIQFPKKIYLKHKKSINKRPDNIKGRS